MMISMIVGISGAPRSGKDTVADLLVSKYGYVKWDWAQTIKDSLHEIVQEEYPEELKDVVLTEEHGKRITGVTPRSMQIAVGQLDRFSPGLWPTRAAKKLMDAGLWSAEGKYVIPSVGKQNQWNFILLGMIPLVKDMGKALWRIDRPGAPWGDNRRPVEDRLGHLSILNDGTLNDLTRQVNKAMEKFTTSHYIRDVQDDVEWASKHPGLWS